jgi:hypothetical protein
MGLSVAAFAAKELNDGWEGSEVLGRALTDGILGE